LVKLVLWKLASVISGKQVSLKEGNPRTDGKNIYVPTSVPYWQQRTHTVHECGHIRFGSDFDNVERLSRVVLFENPYLGKDFINIYEDYRIERLLHSVFLGYKKDRKRLNTEIAKKAEPSPDPALRAIQAAVFNVLDGHIPWEETDASVIDFAEYAKSLTRLIDKAPTFPTAVMAAKLLANYYKSKFSIPAISPAEMMTPIPIGEAEISKGRDERVAERERAEEAVEIAEKHGEGIKRAVEEEAKKEGEGEGKTEGAEAEAEEVAEPSEDTLVEEAEETEEETEEPLIGKGTGEDEVGSDLDLEITAEYLSGSPSGETIMSDSDSELETELELPDEVLEFLEEEAEEIAKEIEKFKREMEEKAKEEREVLMYKKLRKGLHRKVLNNVYKYPFRDRSLTPYRNYDQVVSEYRGLIKNLRKYLLSLGGEESEEENLYSGELMIEQVAEAAASRFRKRDLFRDYEEKEKPKILLLIDLSGSMSGKNVTLARHTAIIFTEALRGITDFAIVGFSAVPGRKIACHYWFKEFGKPINKDAISCINCPSATGNRDGYSIRYALKVAQEHNAKIIILISDGAPCHDGTDYKGSIGQEDTRKAIIEVRRAGVKICGVVIGFTREESWMRHIYGRSFFAVSPDNLPKVLARLVKRMVTESMEVS